MEKLFERGVAEVLPNKEALDSLIKKRKIRIYLGVDPTSPNLHLGHAVVLRKLRQFQDLGHEVVLLFGTFTAQIGDPSGRDKMRQPLSANEVSANMTTYKKQAGLILDSSKTVYKENGAWLEKLNFSDIIKLASYFTVQQMIAREGVAKNFPTVVCRNCKKPFKSPIYFSREDNMTLINNVTTCPHCGKETIFENKDVFFKLEARPFWLAELLYPLMQGYDSVALDVDAELGGTDQIFNMLVGRDLLRSMKQKEKFVIAVPLLLGLDGRKMSKSYENAVNLLDAPSEMYGKLMSLKDALVAMYFELCTDISSTAATPRDRKAELAKEIVRMYHGEKKAEKAEREFIRVFVKKDLPSEIADFTIELPTRDIVYILIKTKMAPSKSQAWRLIRQGGVRFEDKVIKNPTYQVEDDGVIQVGKRHFARVTYKR